MPDEAIVALVPYAQTPIMTLRNLTSGGRRGPPPKYASDGERKAAKSKRQREARQKRNAPLYAAGYMKPRGPKMSDEERKVKHRGYRKNYDRHQREARKNLILNHPNIAAEIGLRVPKPK